MHERSRKNSPIDIILYEIDMLRHCAGTIAEKKAIAHGTRSDSSIAEYNLGIEGFLLHLRNLFEFLTNRRTRADTDLRIDNPEQWASRAVRQSEYSDLVERADKVDQAHGVRGSTCYDQISKYLQHCTTLRHERSKRWDIAKIFADIDPVLQDFVNRFAAEPRVSEGLILGSSDNSTVTPSRRLQLPKHEAF
jgi:predicted dehydrogenase